MALHVTRNMQKWPAFWWTCSWSMGSRRNSFSHVDGFPAMGKTLLDGRKIQIHDEWIFGANDDWMENWSNSWCYGPSSENVLVRPYRSFKFRASMGTSLDDEKRCWLSMLGVLVCGSWYKVIFKLPGSIMSISSSTIKNTLPVKPIWRVVLTKFDENYDQKLVNITNKKWLSMLQGEGKNWWLMIYS